MMNQEHFDLVKDSLSRRKQAAFPEERSEPTQQEVDELFLQRITPETDLPPMQPLFEMFDVPCFYRGELVANCGKAKSGKTFFLSILMAACLTDKALALERHTENNKGHTEKEIGHTDLRSALPLATEGTQDCFTDLKPLRVLWIDTEQSQQSTQEILRDRIIPLAEVCHTDLTDHTDSEPTDKGAAKKQGSNKSVKSEESACDKNSSVCENLFAFNLRGLGFEKRGKMVDVAMRAIKPDIAIIDGIKDLMTDINDAVQATLIMEKLMALAKELNCCIVCVLHQNKSEQDRNMRGSIGTELTNKAFEVYECEYLERHKLFRVTQTLSRRQRMNRELCYVLSKEGLPESCDPPQEQPRDELGRWVSVKSKPEALVKLFNEAMEGHTQRRFNELMAVALKKCGVADAQAYYALVKEAEEQGIIRKAIHPDTKETWVELNDDSVLPF